MFEAIEDNSGTQPAVVKDSHRRLVITVALIVLTATLAVFFILREVETQIDGHAAASSDNRTWVYAQLEVDLLKFGLAVQGARAASGDPAALDAVRLQYDILYSRIRAVGSSESLQGAPLSASREWRELNAPDGFVARLLPLVDGPDAALADALPAIQDELDGLYGGIRLAVVDTVLAGMGRGDQQRETLRQTLRLVALGTLWLFFGVLALMVGLFVQMRSRMRHAHILERAVDNLRNTINSALDAVLILDADGRVVGANRATERIFGGTFNARRDLFQRYLRDQLDGSRQLDLRGLPAGQRLRLQGRRFDGTLFPAEASIAFGRAGNDEPVAVVFVRDISEQSAYEERLAKARNAALQADEAKARFLAVMSHEMRTPLNGMLSAVDLLERTSTLDDEQRWLTDIIRTCGQTTLEQVNNVLQLTRLASDEAGEYPPTAFSLSNVVQDLARQFTADALRHGTRLDVELPPGSLGVRLPLPLLRRALANLLSNAVKFTENGEITLRVISEPAGPPDQLQLRIEVEDTGIGIDPADLERVFRNFETLDASYARIREGSGLGLGIAKLSAEAMGGRITVESAPGVGSCFAIHLMAPVAELTDDTSKESAANLDLAGLHVLVAEDNLMNRTLLIRQLETLGARVSAVVDGAEAVDLVAKVPFDLVLMDVSMPGMDGLAATRAIRAGSGNPEVPIILITAQADPDRLDDFRGAGANEVLTKPARIDMLADLINALARRDRRQAPRLRVVTCEPPDAGHGSETLADTGHIRTLVEDFGMGFVGSMLHRFAMEIEAATKAMAEAISQRDLETLGAVAHKNAGAAAALGLTTLHRLLVSLENASKDGNTAEVRRLHKQISGLAPQSVAQLRGILVGVKRPLGA